MSDSGCSDIEFENLLLDKSINNDNLISLSDKETEIKQKGREEARWGFVEVHLNLIPEGFVVESCGNGIESYAVEARRRSEGNNDHEEDAKDERMQSINISKISPDLEEFNSKTSRGSRCSQDEDERERVSHDDDNGFVMKNEEKGGEVNSDRSPNFFNDVSFNHLLNKDDQYHTHYSSDYGSLPLKRPTSGRSQKSHRGNKKPLEDNMNQYHSPTEGNCIADINDGDMAKKTPVDSEYVLRSRKNSVGREREEGEDVEVRGGVVNEMKSNSNTVDELSDSRFFERYLNNDAPLDDRGDEDGSSLSEMYGHAENRDDRKSAKKVNFNSKLSFTSEQTGPLPSFCDRVNINHSTSTPVVHHPFAGFSRGEVDSGKLVDTEKRSRMENTEGKEEMEGTVDRNIFRSFASRHNNEDEDQSGVVPVFNNQLDWGQLNEIQDQVAQSLQSSNNKHKVSDQDYISIEVDEDRDASQSSIPVHSNYQRPPSTSTNQNGKMKPQLKMMADLNREVDHFFRQHVDDSDTEQHDDNLFKKKKHPHETTNTVPVVPIPPRLPPKPQPQIDWLALSKDTKNTGSSKGGISTLDGHMNKSDLLSNNRNNKGTASNQSLPLCLDGLSSSRHARQNTRESTMRLTADKENVKVNSSMQDSNVFEGLEVNTGNDKKRLLDKVREENNILREMYEKKAEQLVQLEMKKKSLVESMARIEEENRVKLEEYAEVKKAVDRVQRINVE